MRKEGSARAVGVIAALMVAVGLSPVGFALDFVVSTTEDTADLIFADDFESGDTSLWSATIP